MQRPPNADILEAVRKFSLGNKNYPTNKQLLKENIYGGPITGDQQPQAVNGGGGLMGELGGGSPEPDPAQYHIARSIQNNPLARNL